MQAGATADSGPFNGTVNDYGQNVTAYEYLGGGSSALNTSLPPIATLHSDAGVHIVCYRIGSSMVGPNGLTPGGHDYYWDAISSFTSGTYINGFTPPLPAGDDAVVPDAFIYTAVPVNQLVPACPSS